MISLMKLVSRWKNDWRDEKQSWTRKAKVINIEKLWELSRRAYLKKREERESIQDENELVHGERLTASEPKRFAYKSKQILNMLRERPEKEDLNGGFYRLHGEMNSKQAKEDPDQALSTSRYLEQTTEKSEQELWEDDSQTAKAANLAHAKKRQQRWTRTTMN